MQRFYCLSCVILLHKITGRVKILPYEVCGVS